MKNRKRYLKEYVKKHRIHINELQRKYRSRLYSKDKFWRDSGPKAKSLKLWMLKLKSKPCTDCGNKFPTCCMDFDHRLGTRKLYCIGAMFAHHYSKTLISKELKKCGLVCSNCHRIRTQKRRLGSGGKNGHYVSKD
jgi:hypothetical protein